MRAYFSAATFSDPLKHLTVFCLKLFTQVPPVVIFCEQVIHQGRCPNFVHDIHFFTFSPTAGSLMPNSCSQYPLTIDPASRCFPSTPGAPLPLRGTASQGGSACRMVAAARLHSPVTCPSVDAQS